MSWFDSSFSFAKSAFNQAQKSIDKVLDIKENPEDPQAPLNSGKEERISQIHVHPKSSTEASTLSSSQTSHDSSNTEVFNSTWGQSDSTWGSPFSTPSSTQIGHVGDGSKVTPGSKVTSAIKGGRGMTKGTLSTPSVKGERRKKPRSSQLQSPHVTSTPVSEGGGVSSLSVRDHDGHAITPVKPVPQAEKPVRHVERASNETPNTNKENDSLSDGNSVTKNDQNSPEMATIQLLDTVQPASLDITQPHTPPLHTGSTDGPTTKQTSTSGDPSTPPLGQAIEYVTQSSVTSNDHTDISDNELHKGKEQVDGAQFTPDVDVLINKSLPTSKSTDGECLKSLDLPSEKSAKETSGTIQDTDSEQVDMSTTHPITDELSSQDVQEDSNLNGESELVAVSKARDEETELSSHTPESIDQPVIDDKSREGGLQEDASEDTLESLKKESIRLSEVLDIREKKMVEMSREIVSLTEENQVLQKELAEAKEAGQTDVDEMRSEFTRRIGALDKKIQAISKERDSLRKQLQAMQNEQSQHKKSHDDSLSKLLQEKEEQVTQLMEEGEKLSKQELQSNSTIKKLRQKERQDDQLLTSQKQHIEDLEGKIKKLKEQCKKREENERKYQESLGQLNVIAEQQVKELTSLKTERDGLSDKVRSLQTNLDNVYKELADLQKENAVTQSAVQEAAMTAQSSARVELEGMLGQQRVETQREKDALLLQLDELRMSMTRTEQLSARKEDHFRQEIADIQQRLQEAETRNQELTSTISQATKPLLRQIENIQAAHSTQASNWERVEANLTQRLVDAQAQLAQSTEKERSAVEKEMTLQSRVNVLETQASSLRQEKSQLLASEELVKAKLQTLEESQHRDSAKMEGLRASFQQTVDDLRKEKEMLERQLEYERVRLEAESKKARLESQEKERLRSQLVNMSSLSRPPVARQSSSGSVHSQSEVLDNSLHQLSESGNSMTSMFYHHGSTHHGGGSASVIEHLQSLLKQKEGELHTAQTLVGTLERSRSAMAEDLSTLSADNEVFKTQVEEIPPLQEKLLAVERKHEAMLQMYGEKAEEAEELKLDILDLKAVYRQQIDELLSGKRGP